MFKVKSISKFVCLALILTMVFVIAGCSDQNTSEEAISDSSDQTESLLVYCGAGLRKPMDKIAELYQEKTGVEIQYTYAGSAQNLSQIELVGEGDIYVPGALGYYDSANEKGLVEGKADIAYHIPVIAVPTENPANIQSLEDLAKPGVEIVLGDEEAAAIGTVGNQILTKNGLLEAVQANVVAKTPTVNELIVYISMKQADATIIWEDNAKDVEGISIIKIPEEQNIVKTIPICLLKISEKKELAQDFLDFVVSAEGKAIYEEFGFKTVE